MELHVSEFLQNKWTYSYPIRRVGSKKDFIYFLWWVKKVDVKMGTMEDSKYDWFFLSIKISRNMQRNLVRPNWQNIYLFIIQIDIDAHLIHLYMGRKSPMQQIKNKERQQHENIQKKNKCIKLTTEGNPFIKTISTCTLKLKPSWSLPFFYN